MSTTTAIPMLLLSALLLAPARAETAEAVGRTAVPRSCRDMARFSSAPRVRAVLVRGLPCSRALGFVRAYRACRSGCYRTRTHCLQPAFLGRCRRSERFYYRSLRGFRCTERRSGLIRGAYEATVSCRLGARRIDLSFSLFTSDAIDVSTEAELRAAWGNPHMRHITLSNDIVLNACVTGDPIRESAGPVLVDGGGHTLRQGCFEKRLLRQDGTGYVELRSITLTRGGSDGPGGAVTTRGEITVIDSKVQQNLAEEPGGGIMSQRRATIIRSVITGNLANDDGGGVYARRGGIEVYDSVISGNLVDGSGGALGSTGDILVVRSHLDGNTTDGDGGAIYTDEDGDVTVIDSTVSGSDADGPGGAIFTLDGDVTVLNSTLTGNRADDRGGAISGEASVTIINSTISHNLAVAHVGGGVWSRGPMYVANSTISDNYAEGKGGGLHAAGALTLVQSTVANNVASAAANIGVGERLEAFGSIIGPAKTDSGGDAQPTETNCDTPVSRSFGFNVVTDASCGLADPTDVIGLESRLGPLGNHGGPHETVLPLPDSPALALVPAEACGQGPPPTLYPGEQELGESAGDVAALLRRDERGLQRGGLGACDAGAVEVDG
jgi:parallel beta helix pectate lyase-like protein/pectate lyase-like protein